MSPTIETYISQLNEAHWELTEAFREYHTDDVWVRPHPKLLSFGELTAHVAYWEAKSFGFQDESLPILQDAARYYPHQIAAPIEIDVDAAQLLEMSKVIHEGSMKRLEIETIDLSAECPYRSGWNWKSLIQYQIFHIAYHTGQMFSVRHLLGHEPVDN